MPEDPEEKIFVYRVQDKAGRGPWKPGFSFRWVEDRDDLENLVPCFHELGRVDRLALVGTSIGCGCRTLEQLRRWFTPKEYALLLGYGYSAVRMEVQRILGESSTQLVFERAKPLKDGVEKVMLYQPTYHSSAIFRKQRAKEQAESVSATVMSRSRKEKEEP